jgi:hypothetical protein
MGFNALGLMASENFTSTGIKAGLFPGARVSGFLSTIPFIRSRFSKKRVEKLDSSDTDSETGHFLVPCRVILRFTYGTDVFLRVKYHKVVSCHASIDG